MAAEVCGVDADVAACQRSAAVNMGIAYRSGSRQGPVAVDVPRLGRLIECANRVAAPNDSVRVLGAQEILKVLRLVCQPIDVIEESLGAPDEHVVITWK
jgi:hypothetical protein